MATKTLTPEEQIANVQDLLVKAVERVYRYHGKTMRDAKAALEDVRYKRRTAKGRVFFVQNLEWYNDAYAAVACLRQWHELKAAHAAGRLAPLAFDDEMPF